ncbi:MAG: tRNA epoxyqueuosine(34) reductase QueG [Planctomycetota bacterium]|nr:tRNA epoxyqueuosine(34) reductase QueG [Planctomycetota bacterium]
MTEPTDTPFFGGALLDASASRRTELVLEAVRSMGFAHVGICRAEPVDRRAELEAWIGQGKHGGMEYLADRIEQMLDPDSVLPGARSVVCVADRYASGTEVTPEAGPRGRIARYARGRDYHDVLRRRLRRLAEAIEAAASGHRARGVVDTAPLMEREHARRAGLGLIGKHTLMIHPGEGSWMVLGEVLTTLELEPSAPPDWVEREDPCGGCTRCIDACPTDAITPFSVDATRCISYLTIEHRDALDPEDFEATGDWLFGCDVCQEVCPHNRPERSIAKLPVLDAYQPRRSGFDLLEVLGWRESDRREAFVTSALKRAKLSMFKRNALVCAGNLLRSEDHPSLLARLRELARESEEDRLVRSTARQVLEQLGR